MKTKFYYGMAIPLILLLSNAVMAQSSSSSDSLPRGGNLFNMSVTVDNDASATVNMETLSFGFDDATDVFELFEDDSLDSLFMSRGSFTGYRADSGVDARVDYQGILVRIGYVENTDIIQFEVPALAVRVSCIEQFSSGSSVIGGCLNDMRDSGGDFVTNDEIMNNALSGGSLDDFAAARDESEDALLDFLEDSDLANRLWKLLAASSPTSPLAGNPSSMQSSQVSNSFDKGTDSGGDNSQASQLQQQQAQQLAVAHAFPVGVRFGSYSQDNRDVNNYSLPISYAYEWDNGRKISVDLPLGYTTVEDAKVYSASLGIFYTHPINSQWKLTPGINWGVVGSKDLLTGAQIGSLSLTSLYKLDQSIVGGDDWSLSIANMVSYSKSFPISIGDIKIDPDLTNQIIKNGLILDASKALGLAVNVKAYFTDTRFFGDNLYSERYNEIGIFLSPSKKRFLGENQGLNLRYLFAENDIDGFDLSYSYKF